MVARTWDLVRVPYINTLSNPSFTQIICIIVVLKVLIKYYLSDIWPIWASLATIGLWRPGPIRGALLGDRVN